MEQKKKAALTRQKILDAAEMEFTEKGPDAARVDRIARLAGVNKQLIYAHFGSKEGLYTAVLEAVYGRLSSCEETLMKTDFDGPEAVRRYHIGLFRLSDGKPLVCAPGAVGKSERRPACSGDIPQAVPRRRTAAAPRSKSGGSA